MSKFKVGDKVIVRSDLNGVDMYYSEDKKTWDDCVDEMLALRGETVTIKEVCKSGAYKICEADHWRWTDEMFIGLATAEPRREFIVIHRSGNVMTAEHRVNREIIKSAKATCAPSDTFDFETGAKLAFDRLMGREEPKRESLADVFAELEKPEPKPAHKFKVGDRVFVLGRYNGEISAIDGKSKYDEFYLVYCPAVGYHSGGEHGVHCKPEHLGKCTWRGEKDLSPAPEPPKFYTGKVFAEKIIECDAREGMRNRIGRVFEIKNGIIQGDVKQYDLDDYGPIVSFSDFCLKAKSTKWHEVKSDV